MRRTCRTQTTAQFADWAPNIRVCGSVDQSSVGSLKEPGCCIFLLSLFLSFVVVFYAAVLMSGVLFLLHEEDRSY